MRMASALGAIGRVWASGRVEIIDKPANDNQFTRQQLAKDFNITKICLKAFAGGRLARVLSRMQGPRTPCSRTQSVIENLAW